MPDRVVLDASVIAAISFFPDGESERAADAIEEKELITVDLAMAEVGNVAWKRVVHFQEDQEHTFNALQKSIGFIMEACEVIKATDLVEDAYELSVKHQAAFYDSVYLAAAKREKVPLLTLDKKLCNRVKGYVNIKLI